jgi:hypothetical protein
MPIKGFFPTGVHPLPAPHVQAVLFLPRLDLNVLVSFMIDTGADNTTLSLIDVERLNVSYRRLRRSSLVPVEGFGGEQHCYREDAILMFRDEESKTYFFSVNIHIPTKGKGRGQREQQRKLLSVLGRDIINQCNMRIDYQQGIMELTPPEGARLPVATRRLL